MLIMLRVTMITVKMRKIEWTRGMWADCGNVNSPVSLGLFEGEKKVNTSKNHFHSFVCEWR